MADIIERGKEIWKMGTRKTRSGKHRMEIGKKEPEERAEREEKGKEISKWVRQWRETIKEENSAKSKTMKNQQIIFPLNICNLNHAIIYQFYWTITNSTAQEERTTLENEALELLFFPELDINYRYFISNNLIKLYCLFYVNILIYWDSYHLDSRRKKSE